MTDVERLNLIQHYGWALEPTAAGWMVSRIGGDSACHAPTVREALDAALALQAAWATSRAA